MADLIAFVGSARRGGNTDVLATEAMRGARDAGATAGIRTEIVRGADVHDGMEVIIAVVESEAGEGGSRNPLSGRFGRRG